MKYMGSKNRIVKEVVPILQKIIDENNIKLYIEPFVGGANVIDKIKCEKRIGTDINYYLIDLLNYTKDNYQNPNCFPDFIDREYYMKVKEDYKNNTTNFSNLEKGIVGFLASYNGSFFNSYAGIVNTKVGTQRNYYDESKRNLLKQAPNLKNIIFLQKDYKDYDLNKLKNALIYLDPPYKNTAKYQNSDFNHNEFWDWVRKISQNNFVIISEQTAPKDFICIWEKSVERSMSCKRKNKKEVTEKLFIYNN